MPITPIEIATMAPKSQETSHYKQQESQKPLHDQMNITQHIHSETKHNNQQTVKTIKSENKEYRYDAKEKGNNSYSGKNSNKKKKQKETAPKENLRSGSIDIRI